jgi:hypothetical protein
MLEKYSSEIVRLFEYRRKKARKYATREESDKDEEQSVSHL